MVVVESRALTSSSAVALVLQGADAVLDRTNEPLDLRRALDTVAAGGIALAEEHLRELVAYSRMRWLAGSAMASALTPRERQVLECVRAGDTIKETAFRLGVSTKTIEHVRSRLYRKIGVRNSVEAAAWSVGQASPPPEPLDVQGLD